MQAVFHHSVHDIVKLYKTPAASSDQFQLIPFATHFCRLGKWPE